MQVRLRPCGRAAGRRLTDVIRCPACGAKLDARLGCGRCGARFLLTPAEPIASRVLPYDRVGPLFRALGDATDQASGLRAREELSLALTQENRRDLLFGLWADKRGPEADVWLGIAAALDPEGSSVDGLALLERAHAEAVRTRREDLVAAARTYLGSAYAHAGRYADALSIESSALAAAVERRDGWGAFRSAYTRSFTLRFWRGLDPRPAVQELERVGEGMREWEPRIARIIDLARTFILLQTEQRRAGAAQLADLLSLQPTTFAHDIFLRLRAQVLLSAQEGDAERAWQAYADWQSWLSEVDDHLLSQMDPCVEAETALALGDVERARTALERARSRIPPLSGPSRPHARLLRAEVLTHDAVTQPPARRRRSAARARSRANRFERDGLAWHELRWRLLAAELYRSCRVLREAWLELDLCVALADRLGLPQIAFLARSRLQSLARRRPGHFLPELTARQEEIAALVARGATNRDIGRRLRIAESTVARHVSNALLRLGLPNRRELAESYYRAIEARERT